MRPRISKILITGGAGFIGSAFVRLVVKIGLRPIVIDNLSYAGDLRRLECIADKYKFYNADITDKRMLNYIFKKENPEAIVHLAAQTHVDRSIIDIAPFIKTNIEGTRLLLDATRKNNIRKFIHISTDEVYGEIDKGEFQEGSCLSPNSPYAASKAAGDLIVRSYIRTYKFPAIIVRPCNNYGPWQYPEKLIPLAIMKILKNKKVPVYGRGENVREWLYVEDCAFGIWQILNKGRDGEVYNLGSGQELPNIKVVKLILGILNKPEGFEFVKDRPGHDFRYRLSSRKIRREIGWKSQIDFKQGLRLSISWYLENKSWLLDKYSEVTRLYKHYHNR